MGRLSRSTPSVRVNYRKLVDELSSSCDSLKIMPGLPDFFFYSCRHCGHRQKLQTEELNLIVGNAFKMAYAAQLQKQTSFQDVIAPQLDQTQTDKVLWTKELTSLKKDFKQPSPPVANNNTSSEMDVHVPASDTPTLRLAPPSSIPGLKPMHQHKYNVLGPPVTPASQLSTPSSEESNSPTEMNSYKRMQEKPPLIKKILGLTVTSSHVDEDSCPLVSDSTPTSTPGSPTNRPHSGGYVNETEDSKNKSNNIIDNMKKEIVETNSNLTIDNTLLTVKDKDFKAKRISSISSSSSSSGPPGCQENNIRYIPTPPPLPERTDSLNNKEEGELRLAPWFQAGIPREIALEILAQEPVGAFMVRESTSKPGCFALSLRVPRSFQPTGIAHYLIIRANKGYKIKGFTKEFTSLTSLITHHSVMPELLPCPLSLSRYHPNFAKTDSRRDFADIDLDPDYNTLADFRKMMADINI